MLYTVICFIFVQINLVQNILSHVKKFSCFAKLIALLEYLDLSQKFLCRKFCMILAYEIYLTTKMKLITVAKNDK